MLPLEEGEGEEPPMVPEPRGMRSWSCPAWRMWQTRQLAGSVGGAVQAGEAGMAELAVIAPEEFMDLTATASSRGRGGRGKMLHQARGAWASRGE
eukprot:1150842-Pelagomonas_calceolata.AAC.11